MKDAHDNKTGELIPAPKRRGRPPGGKAKTGAERMRALRTRAIHRLDDLKSMPTSSLLEEFACAYRRGHAVTFNQIVDELRKRLKVSQ